MASREDDQRQRQRTEVVGQMVFGIVHDLNNLLTVISVNAEVLVDAGGPSVRNREELVDLRVASDRAATLVRRLLDFGRHGSAGCELLEVGGAIAALDKLIRRVILSKVKVVTRTPPDPHCVLVDAVEFEQVFLNLALNARDAMPLGGTLTIDCGVAEVCRNPPGMDVHGKVQPGLHVRIAVEDTGSGIPECIRERIFEPFFTTKPKGHGTGMGLTTVLGIVQGWGGHIVVLSRPDIGTMFEVFIPVAPADIAVQSARGAGRGEPRLSLGDRPPSAV
ncbi:MAG: sensor histidine kinase [Gemmatimonadaceae bacterium]